MNRKKLVKNMCGSKPFKATDGATVYELLNPNNSLAKNISIAKGFLKPGEIAKLHYHKKSEEIYYILSGHGKVWIEKDVFSVRSGDAICVPKNMIHGLMNTSETEQLWVLAIEAPAYSDNDIFFKPAV